MTSFLSPVVVYKSWRPTVTYLGNYVESAQVEVHTMSNIHTTKIVGPFWLLNYPCH